MFCKTLTFVLSLATAVSAYPSADLAERDNDMNIYAYGTDISGLTVFGGLDGKAYITDAATTNTSLLELVWNTPSAAEPWTVTITEKTKSAASSAVFYIVTNTDAFEDCGFKSQNETAPDGATMTGFMRFGKQIIWSTGSEYISQFWAQDTDVEGLYKLKWNVAGSKKTGSVPVTLKITAPA